MRQSSLPFYEARSHCCVRKNPHYVATQLVLILGILKQYTLLVVLFASLFYPLGCSSYADSENGQDTAVNSILTKFVPDDDLPPLSDDTNSVSSGECDRPSSFISTAGSYFFYSTPFKTEYCSDYIGSAWNTESARNKCEERTSNETLETVFSEEQYS